MIRFRSVLALTSVLATLALCVVQSDARPQGSFGSRGTRTYSAPASTATAPTTARPIERSMTQPGLGQSARPGAATTGAGGGFFNRPGLLGGLAAGFLGAGLFGMLFGHGLFGGLGGIASFLGLIFQAGLVALVIWFVWRMFQRRSQPAYAGPGGSNLRDNGSAPMQRGMLGGLGLGGGLGGASAAQAQTGGDQVGVSPQDFDTFERLLGEIQTAYGREDLNALRTRLTPEMLSYFSEQLSANASRGVQNELSHIKLEQGDLAEAWREGSMEYATVAMRYSLVDRTIDRATGRVVEGGDTPTEAVELWTFVRSHGGQWLLSAIQQT